MIFAARVQSEFPVTTKAVVRIVFVHEKDSKYSTISLQEQISFTILRHNEQDAVHPTKTQKVAAQIALTLQAEGD
jgi:hypothetical protein